jgi:hypothetical protein
LLIAPGRFLEIFGWAPIDPIVSRLLGAAMLGLGWSSYRGWRAAGWDQVAFVVEAEAVFTVLASLGFIRHLLGGSWPWYVWMEFAIFAIFAVAWIYHLATRRRV